MIFVKKTKIPPKRLWYFLHPGLKPGAINISPLRGSRIIIPFPLEAGQVVCLKPIMDVSCQNKF